MVIMNLTTVVMIIMKVNVAVVVVVVGCFIQSARASGRVYYFYHNLKQKKLSSFSF